MNSFFLGEVSIRRVIVQTLTDLIRWKGGGHRGCESRPVQTCHNPTLLQQHSISDSDFTKHLNMGLKALCGQTSVCFLLPSLSLLALSAAKVSRIKD